MVILWAGINLLGLFISGEKLILLLLFLHPAINFCEETMKSNKKRIVLVLAVLTMAIVLSFVFVACDKKKDEPAPPQNTSPSEGLEYSFDKYGSHYGYVVTDIGSCTDNNVIIPSEYKSRTVKSIGDNAFKDCIGITSITIPDSVTSIGYEAFSGCTKLESIYYTGDIASWCKISGLNNLLTSLRTLYINGNKIEGNLNIPNNVTSIGSYSFSFCDKLTDITIPNSVTSIGNDAFRDCTRLVNITIGDSVSNIDSSAFLNTAWYDNQPDGLVYAGKVAYKYKGTMPENTSISLKRDTISINNSTFVNCNGLKSIMIPDSVTTIGDEAFSGCRGLTSITGSATNVSAVARQARPTSFVVNITSGNIIENSAFFECSGLTSITIPDSVTSIGYSAFSNCNRLTTITIPDCVTSIGYSAFSGCKGLTNITIPDSVTSIGSGAFSNTAWYNNQPDGLVYAGKVAYSYKGTMPNNTSIVLKEGTLGIAANAFSDCNELTSVTIPDSVTNIGDGAFSSCTKLTSITIGNGVKSIGGAAFKNCTELTSISIPNSVTIIGYYAFGWCNGLTSITFNGTIAQWNAVSKGENWKMGVPTTEIVCTDGTASI